MIRFRTVILAYLVTFAIGVPLGFTGCLLTHQAPVLTPTAAAGLTNGLTALGRVLTAQGAQPAIINAIGDAQTAIAADVNGTTWGQIVRTLLTDLYSQIPAELQNKPAVWGALAAIEIVLATVGA